jgi:alkylation response protein AidB-like acyl-CoA dehydrogenase
VSANSRAYGGVVDFEFSADQEMLRDSVRRFLSDKAPISYVRDAYDDPGDALGRDAVWDGLRDIGAIGLLVPEEFGGAGMGMVDAAVVLEELGRALCPVPYASTAIGAVSLVLAAGAAREHRFLLPGLADGSTIGALAIYEPEARYQWRTPASRVRVEGEMWRFDGTKAHVADAAAANLLLATALDPDGALGVYALQRDDSVSVEPRPTVDGSRKDATVTFDGAKAWRLGTGDAADAVARTLDRLATAYVVDGVGAAAQAMALAVDYAKERVQFDKPIGSFQAVQHLCADMLRALELGRAAGYYACWAADDADPAEAHRAATMAKAFASDAYAQLGGTAIQVFGGIGFTWEHDIHLYYKRLLSLSVSLGNSSEHLAELARIAID